MTEYEQKRYQIVLDVADTYRGLHPETCVGIVDFILSHVEIKADDQSLPDIPREEIAHIIMERDDILRGEGFVKVALRPTETEDSAFALAHELITEIASDTTRATLARDKASFTAGYQAAVEKVSSILPAKFKNARRAGIQKVVRWVQREGIWAEVPFEVNKKVVTMWCLFPKEWQAYLEKLGIVLPEESEQGEEVKSNPR